MPRANPARQSGSMGQRKLLMRITSVLMLPRVVRSCLPSRDQANPNIRSDVKCVSCLPAPPDKGYLHRLEIPFRVSSTSIARPSAAHRNSMKSGGRSIEATLWPVSAFRTVAVLRGGFMNSLAQATSLPSGEILGAKQTSLDNCTGVPPSMEILHGVGTPPSVWYTSHLPSGEQSGNSSPCQLVRRVGLEPSASILQTLGPPPRMLKTMWRPSPQPEGKALSCSSGVRTCCPPPCKSANARSFLAFWITILSLPSQAALMTASPEVTCRALSLLPPGASHRLETRLSCTVAMVPASRVISRQQ